jgi:transposase-like protein
MCPETANPGKDTDLYGRFRGQNQALRHRTNQYLNNRIEQDHRGIKGRYQPMRGFKSSSSAARFCRTFDEPRNFLRPRSNRNQHVPASHRRLHILSRSLTLISILTAT